MGSIEHVEAASKLLTNVLFAESEESEKENQSICYRGRQAVKIEWKTHNSTTLYVVI